ncbi:hypothetical protein pipiens_016453 [Culex pipiens pipiens]|uniref:Uncharacterized protein n=1 Tax=Culex pipiens pipiens TaxID=38569 RepID=A0ABD1CLD5_CULPP
MSRRSTVTRLRNLMTSFNGIYAFMESYDASKQAGELVMRLEKLEPLWDKIDDAITEAELADSEEGTGEEERGEDKATPEEETEDCAKERRKHVESAAAVSAKSFNESYFAKFNEYWKLIRTTAYWRRYLRNRRLPEAERTLSVPLTTKELQEAEWCLARLVQQEAFGRELQDLAKGKPVHNTGGNNGSFCSDDGDEDTTTLDRLETMNISINAEITLVRESSVANGDRRRKVYALFDIW